MPKAWNWKKTVFRGALVGLEGDGRSLIGDEDVPQRRQEGVRGYEDGLGGRSSGTERGKRDFRGQLVIYWSL